MKFQLLGPVRAWANGELVDLGTRQQRFVLAVLLLEVNRLVTVPRLIDLIWPDDPPSTARGAIHSHVSRLRAALTRARAADHEVLLCRDGPGYVLRCDPLRVDAHEFRSMLVEARTVADDEQRVQLINKALALWQGPALASVASAEVRERLCQSLNEARLTALEDRFDAELRLRRHQTVVEELVALTAEHPTRQRLVGQLMLALHRSQRTAEALETYQRAKQRLADDAGLDPPAELEELQIAILRDDTRLHFPADAVEVAGAPAPVTTPRQLPLDAAGFTGRDEALRQLDALSANADDRAMAIAVIEGAAGVGKTALAVRWAHHVSSRFPDGQLFVDLRGYSPGPVVSGSEALARFLRALGVTGDRLPHDETERSLLYRSLLADRRVLVVLDNADNARQVRPLLPGTPSCLALVTSRERLGGLVAREGAYRVALDVLSEDESITLLNRLLGPRATQEPGAVAELAARCAYLPLALRIAAANLLNHPHQTVAAYTSELRGNDRLDALAVPGDDEEAVRVAFDRSYRRLPSPARRLFRLLGLHPGTDVEPYAAGALAGTPLDTTWKMLDALTGAHLLYEATTGRFQLHDLLRSYACEQVATEEPEAGRQAALTRLLDHYLHTAHAAMDVVYPNRRQVSRDGTAPATARPDVAEYERAMAWLEGERTNLVAAIRCAAAEGRLVHAWTLPHTLDRFFYLRGHLDDWIATHRFALTATRRLDDQRAEAQTLNNLGTGYLFSGRYDEANDHYRQALTVCRKTDDRLSEATTLGNLALLHLRSGRYSEALDHFQHALGLHRQVADRPGEARVLNNLGLLHLWRGQYADAIDRCRQTLGIVREIGDHRNEAAALDNLSVAYRQLGRHTDAVDHAEQALGIFRQLGDRRGEAAALDNLGTAYTQLARHTEALQHHDEALAISRRLGVPGLTCEVLNHTGTSCRLAGRHDAALDHHGQALAMARATGERHEEARAHDGIARTYDDLGHPDRSDRHWHQALALYRELGVPEAEEVQAHLDARGG